MSARSFRSVFMVASCAGAALGCYLVSLNVASERAALEEVETRIVLAQRDIRLLQTEIGTRGRLAQLERWNAKVLALSAPTADQFLDGGFQLARLVRPEPQINVDAPVVLASAPAPQPQSAPLEEGERSAGGAGATAPAAQLLQEASLTLPEGGADRSRTTAAQSPRAASVAQQRPSSAAAAGSKKAGDKGANAAAGTVTKPVREAKVDPLAPLAGSASGKTTTPR